MISAKVLHATSSLGPHKPLITSLLIYPSFIHPHVLTHRAFSRNTSSARAIPVLKFARLVRENPAMPIYYGKDRDGMKATEEVDDVAGAKQWWLESMEAALLQHQRGMKLGLHKEILNRIIQPFQHTVCLVTATEYDGWDEQRLGPGVDEENRTLALVWREARAQATYYARDWHLPYLSDEELSVHGPVGAQGSATWSQEAYRECALVSTARCGRVSFLLENKTYEQDLEKGKDMLRNRHPSPFEHQARRLLPGDSSFLQRNYEGWVQHRAELGM